MLDINGISDVLLPFLSACLCCIFRFSKTCAVQSHFSRVRLYATLQTVARLLCSWNSSEKNTGMACHFLLQETVLTQGLNACLLHWQAVSLQLAPTGKPPHIWTSYSVFLSISHQISTFLSFRWVVFQIFTTVSQQPTLLPLILLLL